MYIRLLYIKLYCSEYPLSMWQLQAATAGCRLQAARLSCCNRWTEAAQVGTFTCKFEICEQKFRKTKPDGVNSYTVRDDITRRDSIRPGEYLKWRKQMLSCYFISHSKLLIYIVSLKFAVPNNMFYLHPLQILSNNAP